MKSLRPALLVLYHCRGVAQLPLRAAIEDHLFAWQRHSRYPAIYHNIAYGFDWSRFEGLPIAAVILDTLALNIRWSPAYFERVTAPLADLRRFDGPRIAMPQDEFIHTDSLGALLARIGCTHVLSAAGPQDAQRIYGGFLPHAQIGSKLTGYLEQGTLERIERMRGAQQRRDIDVGYRAWRAEAWLGAHGMLKAQIADAANALAPEFPQLVLDVSTDEADVLTGDAWYQFLLRCRTTLGVEGGASILDRDGSLCARTRAWVVEHPQASFEQIRDACFPGQDGSLSLFAIGPRHLEACATRTCQLLVEGQYQGVLRAGVDYIPIARDFSNLREVFRMLADDALVQRVAESAWQQVVGSGRYTYAGFVRDIERDVLGPVAGSRWCGPGAALAVRRAQARHEASWRFAQYEARELLPQRNAYETSPEPRWINERRRAARIAQYACLDLTLD
ncbi:hypothetical protein [Ramlibacter rhizophilus]|uniref:Glycosyltransferase family 1 protein n=1 Tax=Ramlibacter rhizophilus TaxID=1781167 RepID=A0A4Z0BN50_9BURK|nr:hypothetical protein [Ramlibacter rhizophilus]TFY99677.1 hypothetical protein EZ242_11055 [Ramlibacter rhizophilus]